MPQNLSLHVAFAIFLNICAAENRGPGVRINHKLLTYLFTINVCFWVKTLQAAWIKPKQIDPHQTTPEQVKPKPNQTTVHRPQTADR